MNDLLPQKEERYFAAANTYHGFVSYYEPLLADMRELYILKGGSGTGKSRLLREFAKAAEAQGEHVIYLYCSFDPDSLDGVLLPQRRIAMADGTTPHVLEARFPGVRDILVDLGQFWDRRILRESEDFIMQAILRKKHLFENAYRLLRAASHADGEFRSLTLQAVDLRKLHAAAERLMREFPKGIGSCELLRPTEALGRRGAVSFPTAERYAAGHIALRDRYEIGDLFLAAIRREAAARSQPISYSPCAADPTRLCKLTLLQAGICFSKEMPDLLPDRMINTERFLHRKIYAASRQKIRFSKKIRDELIAEALLRFAEIGELHFSIEQAYIRAMDFAAKEAFTARLCTEILHSS